MRRADDVGERQHPSVRERPVVGGVGHALEFAEERHFGKEIFVGHGFHVIELSTDPCCHCNANPIYGNRLGKVSCVRAFPAFSDARKCSIFLFLRNSGRKTALALLLELLQDR
ncbi:hypothetical protein ACOJBM_04875 [Rhizobium beringeri]